jgi:hypothetical protein
VVLPGQHQQRTGMPSRVTASPMTTAARPCGGPCHHRDRRDEVAAPVEPPQRLSDPAAVGARAWRRCWRGWRRARRHVGESQHDIVRRSSCASDFVPHHLPGAFRGTLWRWQPRRPCSEGLACRTSRIILSSAVHPGLLIGSAETACSRGRRSAAQKRSKLAMACICAGQSASGSAKQSFTVATPRSHDLPVHSFQINKD